ncbi:MAG: hypothetical protein LBB50_04510 [Oscillospiraceae bacterium]|jgi:hypothetical protein|nr:hypothetical protein [Oscillospiraceae bacterium]
MAEKDLELLEKERRKELEKFEKQRAKWKKQESKKRSKKTAKVDHTALIMKVVAIVISAVIVLGLAALYGTSYGVPARFFPALRVGKSTAFEPEWAFYFYNEYANIEEQAMQYVAYGNILGIDPNASPFGQTSPYTKDGTYAEEGQKTVTWDAYLQQRTGQTLQNMYAVYGEALKAKVQLSKEDKDKVTESMAQLESNAKTNQISVSAMLRSNYAPGVTKNFYRNMMERELLVQTYEAQKKDEFRAKYTDAVLQKEYDANPSQYDAVDFRVFSFAKETLTKNEDESDADLAKRQAAANKAVVAKANTFLAAAKTEQDFIKAADALADKSENPTYDADTATLSPRARLETLVSTYSEDIANWLLNAKRNAGETKRLETDTTYYVAYVVRPAYAIYTVDFYTINIAAETTEDQAEEDAAKAKADADAKIKADELLARWETDGSTKEAFAALVAEAAATSGETAAEGTELGLTEKAAPGTSGETAIDNWLYSNRRSDGQAAVIETSAGYKVVYIVRLNKGDFVWKTEIADTHVSEDYAGYLDDLHKQYPLKENKAGLWFGRQSAERMCLALIAYQQQQQTSIS